MATQELVVPKSIPITSPTSSLFQRRPAVLDRDGVAFDVVLERRDFLNRVLRLANMVIFRFSQDVHNNEKDALGMPIVLRAMTDWLVGDRRLDHSLLLLYFIFEATDSRRTKEKEKSRQRNTVPYVDVGR